MVDSLAQVFSESLRSPWPPTQIVRCLNGGGGGGGGGSSNIRHELARWLR